MARRIKFSLEMKDGAQVRDIEALREHFDLEKIIGYFQDGRLVKWLESYLCADEADEVRKLSGDEPDLGKKLCDILGAEYMEVDDTETIIWRKERSDRLKQFTADPEILNRVDIVAFDQEDLEDIIREKDNDVIYLCQSKFIFPSGILRKKNMRYVGIGKNVEVTIHSKEPVDFESLGIRFDNITLKEIGKPSSSDLLIQENTNQRHSIDAPLLGKVKKIIANEGQSVNQRRELLGHCIVPGFGVGKIHVMDDIESYLRNYRPANIVVEKRKFQDAVAEVTVILETHKEIFEKKGMSEVAGIFDAHRLRLGDPILIDEILKQIEQSCNAPQAVILATEKIAHEFEQMNDEYFDALAVDLRLLGIRIAKHLLRVKEPKLDDNVIIYGQDINGLDFLNIPLELISGIVQGSNCQTTYVEEIARSKSIPMMVGIGMDVKNHPLTEGSSAILAGRVLIINPSSEDYNKRLDCIIDSIKLL